MRVVTEATKAELAVAIADGLLEVCAAKQAAGAIPCVALTGGSMGAAMLQALAEHPELGRVDWARVRLLWGDERWVPAGHAERNDLLADESLFTTVRFDPALVHRMPPSDAGLSLEEAAAEYARLVAGLGPIDIVLNGVGPDGHIASLFPGRDDLLRDEPETPAAIAVRDSPKPPPERITLTLPVMRAADRVWLSAAGGEKAPVVARILSQDPAPLPAALARGREETVLWADSAALGR